MRGGARKGPGGRRSDAGFTLIDVLVAILLLVIGTTGMLAMQLVSLNANVRARELLEATTLAQDQVERLQAGPIPLPAPIAGGQWVDARGCPVDGTGPSFCATLLPGQRYNRTWIIDATSANRFEVVVSWTAADGSPHAVRVDDVR